MKAIHGNSVRIHYKGTLTDGQEFDNSHNKGQTLDFTVGSKDLLKAFNSGIIGMTEGEIKSFTIKSADAYGEYNPEAMTIAPRAAFPEDFEIAIGMQVQGTNPMGQAFLAKITAFGDEEVTLDVNHPLAGEDLTFEVEMVEIQAAAAPTETAESESSNA